MFDQIEAQDPHWVVGFHWPGSPNMRGSIQIYIHAASL